MHAHHADGSFAYVFDCSALASAARFVHKHLHEMKGGTQVEKVLWDAFRAASADGDTPSGVCASAPMMVDHKPGMSKTWNKVMEYGFEGNPNFWANDKIKDQATKTDCP